MFGAATAAATGDLMSAIRDDPRLSRFASSIEAAGLAEELSCGRSTSSYSSLRHAGESCPQFTIFAPNDESWSTGSWTGPKSNLLHSKANEEQLGRVVRSHIVRGKIRASQLAYGSKLPNMEGGEITMKSDFSLALDKTAGRGRPHILHHDMEATNGVIHIVDEAFAPPGTQCPDTVFATVGPKYDRSVIAMGYDQRHGTFTTKLATEKATKPVAIVADDNGLSSGTVFWTNDMDYPHGSATSWASSVSYTGKDKHHVVDNLIDPQGIAADPESNHLYFAEHSGHAITRTGYNGSGKVTLVQKPGNESFQPSGVAVDNINKKLFASIEQPNSTGYIAIFNIDGSGERMLAGPHIVNPYGLCVDDFHQHVYYIVGGHGGQIRCVNYGPNPCKKPVVLDIVDYAYNCAVDNSLAPHGGPTKIAFSVSDDVYFVTDEGGEYSKLDRENITVPLKMPMGVAFGCLGK